MRKEAKHLWRQLLCLMLTFALVIGLMPASSMSVEAKSTSTTKKATYTGRKKKAETVIVPEQITKKGKTYKVTAIGYNAFNNKRVKNVILPETVTKLNNGAFAYDTKLKAIKITSKKLTLGKNLFRNVSKKKKAKIKVYVSTNMSKARFRNLERQLVKQGLKKKNIYRYKVGDDEFESAAATVSDDPYKDVDLSNTIIVGQDDFDQFDASITLDDGSSVMDNICNVISPDSSDDASSSEANGIGIGEIAEFTKEIIETVGNHQKYDSIMEAFEEIQKGLEKLNDIEQEIQNISSKLDQQRIDNALKSRNKTLISLSSASLPVLKTIHKYMLNEDGTYDEKWFSDEEKFDKVYGELTEWANKTVDGNTMTTAVPTFLTLYTTPQVDNLNYIQMYDNVAFNVYPWEHEGYTFRENARLGDFIIMIETYMLSDLYYECYKEATGLDKDSYVEQLQDCLKAYLKEFNDNPVTHHDDTIICQIAGCHYSFAKNIDFIDMCTSARSNFSNKKFDMASDNESTRKSNIAFMENVLYRSNVYSNAALNKDLKTYSTYEYVPANVYQKIYCYYMERNKKTSDQKDKVNNFFQILQKAGFTNADQLTSTGKDPVLVTKVDRGYESYSRHGGFGKNYLNYKNFHLCCNPWRKNHDSIDLSGLLDRNMKEKTGGGAEIIDRCNFKSSEYLNNGGRNTNLLLMSLHVVSQY